MKKILTFSMVAAVALSACAYNTKQPTDDTYYKRTQGIAWPTEQKTTVRTVVASNPVATKKTVSSGQRYTTAKSVTSTTKNVTPSSNVPSAGYNTPSSNGGAIPVSGYASQNVPSAAGVNQDDVVWADPKAPVEEPKPVVKPVETPKVAVPEDPGLKLQCAEMDNKTYTCRLGNYFCGTGCKSDGSECANGYCLESYCADVLGQKWTLVNDRREKVFGCKHPSYDVMCRPERGSISCYSWWGDKRNGFWETCGRDCNQNGTQCQNGSNNCWDKYR